ncbi:MAG: methyltransferase domain-containing protein [Chloroflexota bacterium]|nr:methyltransferase domain-containing protein [Chloroflexota bacterium]
MTKKHPPICDYEGSDYQSTFWDEGGRAYEDQAENVALRRLLPPSGRLVLEIGAGAGRNTPRYQGYERVVLMDYSLTQVQQAQERLGHSERYIYVAADVYRLPFVDTLFDGATMIRVLHHIAEPPQALAQIRRVLEPGGTFILEFANKLNLKAIGRYILRRQDWNPFTLEPVEFVPLNFDFHPKTVRSWLRDADFSLERQLTVSHFRLNLLKRLVPTRLLVTLDAAAQFTGEWWQLTPSVFTKSLAVGQGGISPPQPDAFFRCPACENNDLTEKNTALICSGCGREWPIVDGIYDFRD